MAKEGVVRPREQAGSRRGAVLPCAAAHSHGSSNFPGIISKYRYLTVRVGSDT